MLVLLPAGSPLLKGERYEQISQNSTASRDAYSGVTIQPAFFFDTRMAWLWLIVRLYVGYQWIAASWWKLTGYSLYIGSFGRPMRGGSWVFSTHSGAGLALFINHSIAQAHTTGMFPQVQGWYAFFLQYAILPFTSVLTYVVTFGELLVGLGILLGAFTGIAAFFGIFMNVNYLLAGSVSINPILIVLSVFLMLAWRISGFYGIDRYLLPFLGTPWTGPLTADTDAPEAEYSTF